MENQNPTIKKEFSPHVELSFQNGKLVNVTTETVFEILRSITDPEHPYSLEQLSILTLEDISVVNLDGDVLCQSGKPIKTVKVTFTPTVPHCSMAGIIGLCILYQLAKHIEHYNFCVEIRENTHNTFQQLNKQLSDRDRVFAAFENEGLLDIIKSCTPML